MAKVQGPNRKFFQSCLFWVLIVWTVISVISGVVLLRLAMTREPEAPTPSAVEPVQTVAIEVTVIAPPVGTNTEVPTETPIPTITLTPTDTPTETPTPTPSYEITSTQEVAVYLEPKHEGSFLTKIKPEAVAALQMKAITTDREWIQVCCFAGAPKSELWVKYLDVKIERTDQIKQLTQVIPPTATPDVEDTNFMIEAGPEYYETSNGLLVIYVKVFQGPEGTQAPLPGYMLRVYFKDEKSDVYEEMLPTNSGSVSQAEYTWFKNNIHIYNLKYEYDPGNPPQGKTKQDLLGAGVWKFWLTNAQGTKLSPPKEFVTNPMNPRREIFISYGLVR